MSGVPAVDNLRRWNPKTRWVLADADMLEAIDAHVVTVMAHYLGQDDAYEEGYFDACFKIHSILHPEEGL